MGKIKHFLDIFNPCRDDSMVKQIDEINAKTKKQLSHYYKSQKKAQRKYYETLATTQAPYIPKDMVGSLHLRFVDKLPVKGEHGILYLHKNTKGGYDEHIYDGLGYSKLGSISTDRILEIQKLYGLKCDGIPGPRTLEVLLESDYE